MEVSERPETVPEGGTVKKRGGFGKTQLITIMPILPNKSLVARNTDLTRATRPVTYLTPEEVRQIESAALESPRKGERDALVVRV